MFYGGGAYSKLRKLLASSKIGIDSMSFWLLNT